MTGNVILKKSTERQLNFETTYNPIDDKKLNPPLLPDEIVPRNTLHG